MPLKKSPWNEKKNVPEKSPQNKVDRQETIAGSRLHDACRKGNLTRVKRILSQSLVHLDMREGNHGKTPLMVTAQEGHCRIFDFLITKGANKLQVDNNGKNILHWACKGGHVGMVDCLLPQYGVNINDRYMPPLAQAAYQGYSDVVEFLVCMGADMSQTDSSGDSALHWACKGGHLDIVKYLLSQCSVDINYRGRGGQTPLMAATLWERTDVGQLLVSMGANLSQVDDVGNNALHWVSKYGNLGLMESVLSQGSIDINRRGRYGRTPLMNAAYKGKTMVFDLLVSKGCLTHLVDDQGHNVLHLASLRGRVEIVKHILSQSMIDVNVRDKKGETAAMLARHVGHFKVYDLLVSRAVR
ncbi:ankyrin repeat domain-containing protein 50-like [Haliotis asinina]|uniref:ankyrin repeat domain-containing protein 50-like n=1 Tax=Haliotis asinina TaxID=109174 RepID=UPI003531C8BE